MSQDQFEEENLCPLCMEELDPTDKSFIPCTCGYQMCRFCWHHIKENLNGKCPHCRQPYNPQNYTFTPPDPEELAKQKKESKRRERSRKTQEANSRKQLANVRVIQRNLVYVTNLPLNLAREEILRKNEYFGQYGKILKIVVNKHNIYNADSPGGPSVSAYITYQKKEEAMRAIQAVNGAWIEGPNNIPRQLRGSYGTTKYCTYFLRNLTCTNPDCMYLHELGSEKDSFTKEEMSTGKHHLIPESPHVSPVPPAALKSGLPPPISSTSKDGQMQTGNMLTRCGSQSEWKTSSQDITTAWNLPIATPSALLDPGEWPTTETSPPNLGSPPQSSLPTNNNWNNKAIQHKIVGKEHTTGSIGPQNSAWGAKTKSLEESGKWKGGLSSKVLDTEMFSPSLSSSWVSLKDKEKISREENIQFEEIEEMTHKNQINELHKISWEDTSQPDEKKMEGNLRQIITEPFEHKQKENQQNVENVSSAEVIPNALSPRDKKQIERNPWNVSLVPNVSLDFWSTNGLKHDFIEESDPIDFEQWNESALGFVDLLLGDRDKGEVPSKPLRDDAGRATSRFGFAQERMEQSSQQIFSQQTAYKSSIQPNTHSTPHTNYIQTFAYEQPSYQPNSTSIPQTTHLHHPDTMDLLKKLLPHANISIGGDTTEPKTYHPIPPKPQTLTSLHTDHQHIETNNFNAYNKFTTTETWTTRAPGFVTANPFNNLWEPSSQNPSNGWVFPQPFMTSRKVPPGLTQPDEDVWGQRQQDFDQKQDNQHQYYKTTPNVHSQHQTSFLDPAILNAGMAYLPSSQQSWNPQTASLPLQTPFNNSIPPQQTVVNVPPPPGFGNAKHLGLSRDVSGPWNKAGDVLVNLFNHPSSEDSLIVNNIQSPNVSAIDTSLNHMKGEELNNFAIDSVTTTPEEEELQRYKKERAAKKKAKKKEMQEQKRREAEAEELQKQEKLNEEKNRLEKEKTEKQKQTKGTRKNIEITFPVKQASPDIIKTSIFQPSEVQVANHNYDMLRLSEVEALERKVANARREEKELAEKLVALQMRNQEFERLATIG